MARHWNDEKKQDDAPVAPAEARRKTTTKKKKANPSSKPSASMDVPSVAAKARTTPSSNKKKSPLRNTVHNNSNSNGQQPKGSLLDAVSAIMGPGTSTATVVSDITTDTWSSTAISKPKKNKSIHSVNTNKPSRQVDESDGAEQPVQPRSSSITIEKKKAARPRQTKSARISPPPPPPPTWIPTTTTTTTTTTEPLSFLQNLEAVNQDRKLNDGTSNNEATQTIATTKKKKKKKPKLSLERQRNLQKELAKRRRNKSKSKDLLLSPDENEPLQDVEWFNMSIKANNSAAGLNYDKDNGKDNEKDTTKKSKKKTKVVRTTVEYSRTYNFWTKKEVLQEESQPGYYSEMIVVKRRTFHIRNLVSVTAARSRSSPYQFHNQLDTLQAILDRKEDKWFIKSRLDQYIQQQERAMDDEDDDDEEEEEQGMEALSIFFGPNDIDDHNNNAEDNDDDNNSGIFSVDSVESVHFSDDDEDDRQLIYNGTKREMVEVMPGEFTILRKEEETHAAMKDGTYIESLCLGCGKALLSVQDALQVACPNCGSITPLNGICLHKPFGIATGIAAAKVKDQLAPRKNVFELSTERAQHPSSQSTPTGTRRVSTVADMKWTTGPSPSSEQTQPPAPPPAQRPTGASRQQQRTTQQRPRPASAASPQQEQQPIPPAIQSRRPRQLAKTTKSKPRPRKLLAGHG